ncbi:hypothetical protein L6164_000044 [Bauhinia variegata]|uniref:Uncharacterized protein n=1 Tax=Bauhinia variegata TaxID=167791 RepID=A0ACB9Q4T1_BAUVA|nr:hypothetical protein L6164_000044 [Bauhinia variegata]
MGVFTFEEESTSPVAPARLYKALALDADSLIPKINDSIKNVENVSGNGEPGTIKKITIVEGGKEFYVKHQIDGVDKDNLGYNYSIVEGLPLPESCEKISIETKLVAAPNGGSIVKLNIKFFTKGDAQLNEEQLKIGKEKSEGFFKSVEAYLLANPSYN